MRLHPNAFGYSDIRFSWGDHICAFFDDHLQQMEVMVPFIATGLQAKQRCLWAGPEVSCHQLRESLAVIGGDLPTLEASGQLIIISEIDFYLENGVFEPRRAKDLVQTLLEDGQHHGYHTMRVATDVSWALEERLDAEAWQVAEAQATLDLADLPVVAVCQYHRRQVSGAMVMAALRSHPFVIMDGDVHENPFYVAAHQAPAASVT